MKNIIQEVKDEFVDINNISSMLNSDYSFDPPASSEEISNWEKENNIKIPDMYKSWLMLTKYARILEGEFELFFPEISKIHKDAVVIGSIGGSGKDLLFSSKTGEIYSVDDEIEKYENFVDFLAHVYIRLESEAEDEFGDSWTDIYDEKFGNE